MYRVTISASRTEPYGELQSLREVCIYFNLPLTGGMTLSIGAKPDHLSQSDQCLRQSKG